jgi:hypothetical protein
MLRRRHPSVSRGSDFMRRSIVAFAVAARSSVKPGARDEHSYQIDFGAKAAADVDTFMETMRWMNVDRLLNLMS